MKKQIYILLSLIAVFSFVLVLPAKAVTLDNPSTTPASAYITHGTTYKISFETTASTTPETQVRLIFPAGFNVSNNTDSSTITAASASAITVATSTVSNQEITLWLVDAGVTEAAANTTLHIGGISVVNHTTAAAYTLGIETRGGTNDELEVASSTAFTILGAYAARSTIDTSKPTSKITSPTAGANISAGQNYVISGTGADTGGSTISKVEISLDDGKTWSSANFTATGGNFNWTYNWQNPTAGEYTIKVRATDSAGNTESPSAGVKVTVTGASTVATTPASTSTVLEKPISQMTTQEIQAKIIEIEEKLIELLKQLIQLLRDQL